jgi:hypothetical protein
VAAVVVGVKLEESVLADDPDVAIEVPVVFEAPVLVFTVRVEDDDSSSFFFFSKQLYPIISM